LNENFRGIDNIHFDEISLKTVRISALFELIGFGFEGSTIVEYARYS
jgi:hypothetical protein